MRLNKIKLAGFKSFVDPTTIPLQTNRTAIVGPNGCGKSNVIDAVRWVMGELSAKQLRGEASTDVIFNGAEGRKPVGQASVELIFDNTDGTVTGEYATYNEIAVRREVNRDGMSNYYLNATRCRRKDILDIFWGTGLGPRSYSIIEQGMITQLIESKPEELRGHLEEAAGISKYKERRRETETRVRHTKENISRLNDIREEIEKQLDKLKRQSRAAERYKKLKEEHRSHKAQLLALQWRLLDDRLAAQASQLKDYEVQLEARIATLRGQDAKIEKHRIEHTEFGDVFNEVQGRYYSLGADIARIEQQIQHNKERHSQLEQDLAQVAEATLEIQQNHDEDQSRLEGLKTELEGLRAKATDANEITGDSEMALIAAEQAMKQKDAAWEEFNRQTTESSQRAGVEQERVRQLEQKIHHLSERIERYESDLSSIEVGSLPEEIETTTAQASEIQTERDDLTRRLSENSEQIQVLRAQKEGLTSEIDQTRARLQEGQNRHASLIAVQQIALGHDNTETLEWLESQGLADKPRLIQEIDVEEGWERALETVIHDYIDALCVDTIEDVVPALKHFKKGDITILGTVDHHDVQGTAEGPLLTDKIKSDYPVHALIGGVRYAETLDDAFEMRASLANHESVITSDGVWLGRSWLRVRQDNHPKMGSFERERELKQLTQEIQAMEGQLHEMMNQWEETGAALAESEGRRDSDQARLHEVAERYSELHVELGAKTSHLEHLRHRTSMLNAELNYDREEHRKTQEVLATSQQALQDAEQGKQVDESRREDLLEQRNAKRGEYEATRECAQRDKREADTLNMQVESRQNELQFVHQSIERAIKQLANLRQRQDHIGQAIKKSVSPLDSLGQELEAKLEQRLVVETELNDARHALEQAEHALRETQSSRADTEEQVQEARNTLDQARIQAEGIHVRRETLETQIDASGFERQILLEQLQDDVDESWFAEQLERIQRRIERLGPINLAALDEYEQEAERKSYLDAQHADLFEALTTLEDAIRKIDRETRNRFKQTFENVNQGFQRLFPKIFGGGQASLEMTDNDLLNTGVVIRAQPPGKRNSTIHLLSGGEKALTSIALVFSIFQLNPAPFCMLDEVDAPLDDANILRFSQLVKEMSENVQFIVITHNKGTMEVAEQLAGVTMHEPGVSRMVSVDIDQAMALAEAA